MGVIWTPKRVIAAARRTGDNPFDRGTTRARCGSTGASVTGAAMRTRHHLPLRSSTILGAASAINRRSIQLALTLAVLGCSTPPIAGGNQNPQDVDSASGAEVAAVDAESPDVGPYEVATPGCKDLRHAYDNKIPWDYCWDPPHHYCSWSGDAETFTLACAPGFSHCCAFPTTCRPCGWTECAFTVPGHPPPSWDPPGCPTQTDEYNKVASGEAPQPAACAALQPTHDGICWDDVPAEWNLEAAHTHDYDGMH